MARETAGTTDVLGQVLRALAADASLIDEVVEAARAASPEVARLPEAENRRHIAVMVAAAIAQVEHTTTHAADQAAAPATDDAAGHTGPDPQPKEPTREVYAAAEALGADRAMQGIPIEALLRGVHAGRTRAVDIAVAYGRAAGVPTEAMLDALVRFNRYAGALERHVISGHRRAELELSRTARDAHTHVLRQLLTGEGHPTTDETTRAGLRPDGHYHCVLSDVSDPVRARALEQRLATFGGVYGLVEGRLAGLAPRAPTLPTPPEPASDPGGLSIPVDSSAAGGRAGSSGPVGSSGLVGAVGSSGSAGRAVSSGAFGSSGAVGDAGLPGSGGSSGVVGQAGASGPVDPSSTVGRVGPSTSARSAGSRGRTGSTTSAGPPGATDQAGVPAPAGTATSSGRGGAPGPLGPLNSTGSASPSGPAGRARSTNSVSPATRAGSPGSGNSTTLPTSPHPPNAPGSTEALVIVAPAAPLRDVRTRYRLCLTALEAAKGRRGVHHLADLAGETALAAQPALADLLAQEYLGALDPGDPFHRQLVSTGLAYLDHGQRLDQTAEALHVHPNTVRYRLAKLAELTGSGPAPTTVLHTLRWWWALHTWLHTEHP